jgi:hypothetical protein
VIRNEDGVNRFTISLDLGKHSVKGIFYKATKESRVTIKYIKIVGTTSSNGGALDCVKCPTVNYCNFNTYRDSLINKQDNTPVLHARLDILQTLIALNVRNVLKVSTHQL